MKLLPMPLNFAQVEGRTNLALVHFARNSTSRWDFSQSSSLTLWLNPTARYLGHNLLSVDGEVCVSQEFFNDIADRLYIWGLQAIICIQGITGIIADDTWTEESLLQQGLLSSRFINGVQNIYRPDNVWCAHWTVKKGLREYTQFDEQKNYAHLCP